MAKLNSEATQTKVYPEWYVSQPDPIQFQLRLGSNVIHQALIYEQKGDVARAEEARREFRDFFPALSEIAIETIEELYQLEHPVKQSPANAA